MTDRPTITQEDREAVLNHYNQLEGRTYEHTALHFAAQLREAKAAMAELERELAEADRALLGIVEDQSCDFGYTTAYESAVCRREAARKEK